MQISSLFSLICTSVLMLGVAVVAPAQPIVTVEKDGERIVARYGVADDIHRQSKLVVKELSLLLKKYPDAKSWAVAYNTAPGIWRAIEYHIERRQLIGRSQNDREVGTSWGYDYFPAHIHRGAQQSLNIEELWRLKKPKQR